MSIAAIIVEFRSPERTANCIRSLLGHGGCSFVLVVDNSDDDGRTFAELGMSFEGESHVRIFKSAENLGFGAGVNLGLEQLRAYHGISRVLVINNDAVAEDGVVEALSGALQSQPDAVVAFPPLLHAGVELREVYYHRWLATLHSTPGWGRFPVPRGCCFMLALDRWNGPIFDEAFFMYGEEIELGWRIRETGRPLFVPGPKVLHEGSGSSVRGSPFYEEHTSAAHWLLSQRLAKSPSERLLLVPIRATCIVVRGLLRSARSKSFTPMLGVFRGWSRARRASAS